MARLTGARKRLGYSIDAGERRVLRFPLRRAFLAKLERRGEAEVMARARNTGESRETISRLEFTLAAR